MRATLILILLLAPALAAQDYDLATQVGIGGAPQTPGMVMAPFTPLVVYVQRTDTRPFAGRLVVRVETQPMGRGPFASDMRGFELVQEVAIAEGATHAEFTFELPVFHPVVMGSVTLERAGAAEGETVASTHLTASGRTQDGTKVVGFISQARLESMKPWLHETISEIQVAELPENWKLLAGFDAIILNDDRLSRRQAEALVDYVVAGGNLIVSPNSAAAFNPELPIARLLGAAAGTPLAARLADFEALRKPPLPVMGAGSGPAATLPAAADGATLGLWPDAGRARASDKYSRLLSHTRCGAGSVVFVHADLSGYPLVADSARGASEAGVCLVHAAIQLALPSKASRPPLARMSSSDSRDVIDIAGKRIPNRDLQLLLIFLYIGAAGIGTFLFARRIRRPELYPAVLLALALLSVGMVFTLGQVYKRAGDRTRVVQLVVGDGGGGRNAVYTVGCAYVYEGASVEFAQDRASWLVPAQLRDGGWSDLPADFAEYRAQVSPVEVATSVGGLTRWQNQFFASASPSAPAELRLTVRGDQGGYTVENFSPHQLYGCLVVLPGPPSAPPVRGHCQWHYLPALEPAGSPDARAPLSQATRATSAIDLAELVRKDAPDELTASALIAFVGISDRDAVVIRDLPTLETTLENSNLLPQEGEFLVLCMLPQDAVSKGAVGVRGVEPDKIGQAVLWAARGVVQAR